MNTFQLARPRIDSPLVLLLIFLLAVTLHTNARAQTEQDQASQLVLTPSEDTDLAFNQLWMRQYQDDYHYRKGNAALGKILRLKLREWYLSRKVQRYSSRQALRQDSVDYDFRLSEDRVRLGIEYSF